MQKRVVLAIIIVILSSFCYAEESAPDLFQNVSDAQKPQNVTKIVASSDAVRGVQTKDIDEYVDAYKKEMDTVLNSAQNNIVGVAYNVFNSFDGFTFYDVGEIVDTRGNRQKLYDLWKDDEVFVSSEGIVVNDHTANEVVYTLRDGNMGVSRTGDGTRISSSGATKVDKISSNVVIMNGEQILSGAGTDFFVPNQNFVNTNSKYTYSMDSRVGVIPNYGGIDKEYFKPFSFGPTGMFVNPVGRATDVPGTITYNLLAAIYYDSGMSNANLLRKNTVAIDQGRKGYNIKANCCSYMYLADSSELKAFPLIARKNLKGDTGVVLDKDVKVYNSYTLSDDKYTYTIEPSAFGTLVKTSEGKIIQSSNMLPFSPRNEKEERLLSQ